MVSLGFLHAFPDGTVVKNPPANAGDVGDVVSITWVGKVPWRRKWQPTPVFLPGESYGQKSVVGYSPWGHKRQTGLSTHATLTKFNHSSFLFEGTDVRLFLSLGHLEVIEGLLIGLISTLCLRG